MKPYLTLLLTLLTTTTFAQQTKSPNPSGRGWGGAFTHVKIYYAPDSITVTNKTTEILNGPAPTTFKIKKTPPTHRVEPSHGGGMGVGLLTITDSKGSRSAPVAPTKNPPKDALWQFRTLKNHKTGRVLYTYYKCGTLQAVLRADGYWWLIEFYNDPPLPVVPLRGPIPYPIHNRHKRA